MDAVGRAASGLLIAAVWCAASATDAIERGAELARSGRWEEARAAFLQGERQAPGDKRFPLELAGIEYRLQNFSAAKRYLRRALHLDRSDRYANDFLGTLYFLEGNLEGALRYWNRIRKPQIDDVTIAPQARLNPVLLDSALALAPASLLTLDGFRTTQARLDALGVFPSYRLELAAHPDEHFDLTLHWLNLPAWVEIASAFRGAAYQTLQPELRNIAGSGINWDSMLRWDAQKRRARTSLAGPLSHNARWRYGWYADARSETWNSGKPQDFRLQRVATGAEFQAVPSWRFSWSTGLEVSSRHFAGLPEFRGGAALKYRAGLNYQLLRIPEHRITLASTVNADLGRSLSRPGDRFAQGQASLDGRWFLRPRGDDYELHAGARGGSTQGSPPFDELFMVGVERDNDLWLRGHAGTIGGKKGSAPIGRNYFLANGDFHKELYRHPLFTAAAGPFLDTGRTNDVFARAPFRRWMLDSGVEASLRLAAGVRVTLLYGRDLRSGGHVIYATVGRAESAGL